MNRVGKQEGEMARRRSSGFSLIEIMVALGIVAIVTAVTLPNVNRYMEAGRGRAAAKSVADAFHLARAQAIRTGNNHIVYFETGTAQDIAGNPIQLLNGQRVWVLVLNDGAPGSANQNCEIDAVEELVSFEDQQGVSFGFNAPLAAQVPPDEQLPAIPAMGSSFREPNAGPLVNRVMFRPDGIPVAFDNFCVAGRLGSGGGTIYLTTANKDFAITMSPLGAVRVHTWDVAAGGWTS